MPRIAPAYRREDAVIGSIVFPTIQTLPLWSGESTQDDSGDFRSVWQPLDDLSAVWVSPEWDISCFLRQE